MAWSKKHEKAQSVFVVKNLVVALSVALGCSSAFFSNNAGATPVFYTADNTNTTIGSVGLSEEYLGNSVLSNPSSLATGPYNVNYAVVLFRPNQSGTYVFGQTQSPVDSVMILYDGPYQPTLPGAGAVDGNDDTLRTIHQATLGDPTLLTQCGPSINYCPQVSYTVVADQVYALWVSVYNGATYNASFTTPFQFYSSGTGQFGSLGGLIPINTSAAFHLASDLDFTVLRDFQGGMLRMNQAGQTYSLGFVVHNTPNNTIDQFGNDSTFAGVLSDAVPGQPGSLTIVNSGSGGSVTFFGVNTYSGGTTIGTNAILNISADENLGAATGGLILNGGTLRTMAGISSNRNLDVAAQGGTLDVASNTALALGGTVTGSGSLIKAGAGTLSLSGNGSAFTGSTTVLAGGMVVEGILGGTMTVASGSILAGSGTVGTLTVQGGAMITPGNASMGTLSVNGNTTFDPGSVYVVRIDSSQASDKLAVSGTVTLNGGTVKATLNPGASINPNDYPVGQAYTILTANGGVFGRFADLLKDFAFFDLLLDYDANNVYLKVKREAFNTLAETPNQWQAATWAETLGVGNPVYNAISTLPNDVNIVRHAYDQISGEAHASTMAALIEDNHFVRDATNDRLRAAYRSNGKTSASSSGNTEMIDPRGNVLWGRVFGATGHLEGNRNAAELDRSIGGFVLGADVPVANWQIGALAGYSRSDYDVNVRNSHGTSDNYHIGAYAGSGWDAWSFRTGLFYTWHDVDMKRTVSFPGYFDSLKSDYDARSIQAFGEMSYLHTSNTASFEPFANLTHVNLHTDSFTERGGAAALHASGQTTNTTFTTVGFRVANTFTHAANMQVRGTLGWRHAFGDIEPQTSLGYVGGSRFTVAGTPIAKDSAVLEAGVDMRLAPAMVLSVSYQGLFGEKAEEHGGYVHFNWKF